MWRRIKLRCGMMPFPAHLHGARFDHIKGMADVALADDLTAFSKELLALHKCSVCSFRYFLPQTGSNFLKFKFRERSEMRDF
jgi:hypothetical protein